MTPMVLLVLYVLSIGPVSALFVRYDLAGKIPKWLFVAIQVFYWPLNRVYGQDNWVGEALQVYVHWWHGLVGV